MTYKPLGGVELYKADNFIAIMAFRYALGRMTAAPSHCIEWLSLNMPHLSETTLRNIDEEIEDARRIDDDTRGEERVLGGMLGMAHDRARWLAFQETVRAERRNRPTPTVAATDNEGGEHNG